MSRYFGSPASGGGGGGGSVVDLVAAPGAGYCWFNGPRAYRAGGFVYFNEIDSSGNCRSYALEEATGTVTGPIGTYPSFQADDHDNASFLKRASDGHILAAFSAHVGDAYLTTGTAADDVTSLTLANTVNITSKIGGRGGSAGYTYISIHQLTGEASDPIYLDFRYHDFAGTTAYAAASKSTDGGANWTDLLGTANSHSLLATVTYHRSITNGTDRLDFAFSNHPEDPSDFSIYHCYYQSGNLYQTDGTLIGAVGSGGGAGGSYPTSALTKVYNATGGDKAWIWDIAIDGSGQPVIGYVVYTAPYATGAWEYQRAHVSAGSWVTHTVADAGTRMSVNTAPNGSGYAGGIAIDRYDTDTVYYSTNTSGQFQIYSAVTADNGATWTPTAITAGSDKAVRPTAVEGDTGQTVVLWEHGSYTDYLGNYSMAVAALR